MDRETRLKSLWRYLLVPVGLPRQISETHLNIVLRAVRVHPHRQKVKLKALNLVFAVNSVVDVAKNSMDHPLENRQFSISLSHLEFHCVNILLVEWKLTRLITIVTA